MQAMTPFLAQLIFSQLSLSVPEKFIYIVQHEFEFSQNYQQHKVGISTSYFFPFISLDEFIIVTLEYL